MTTIRIPDPSLVVLVGASGCGKSTFARRHFRSTEVVSSDFCRGLVSDDENDQTATRDAFDVLHTIVAKRLASGRLTVIDATNVQADSRRPLIDAARRHHALPVAIVFDLPENVCLERNAGRPDRTFGPHVVRNQRQQLRRSIRDLGHEGFRHVYVFRSEDEVNAAEPRREPLYNDRRWDVGPFDIIGDVHGCFEELKQLMQNLGYEVRRDQTWVGWSVRPPEGRKAVFLGDLVDRGPRTPDVLRLVMGMVRAGTAICVPGNHDEKLKRKLAGKNVRIAHGLEQSLEQLESETRPFRDEVMRFIDSLVSHYVLDQGRLVVAHAGMKAEMQGRASSAVREFALYGETSGETDEFGLPVRYNWAADYKGRAAVVYGHTPVLEPEWLNGTINIDTGCVFGGALTALRWPERELVSVPSQQQYAVPGRPIRRSMREVPAGPDGVVPAGAEDLIDLDDLLGKRGVETRLRGRLTIQEGQAAAALEVMTRFGADPHWLVYLPPTMSPSGTSSRPGLLEHPAEAFEHYRQNGVTQVVCEEKHMGSRAVVIVGRTRHAVGTRFGLTADRRGIVYTRTGRPFFSDPALESSLLDTLSDAFERAGLWKELATDWAVLDCELMPWSAKALELIRRQYAAVGAAASADLAAATRALESALARTETESDALAPLLGRLVGRREAIGRFTETYRRYCWPVEGLKDLRLAPFHILATEGAVHVSKTHQWHLEAIERLCAALDDDPRGGVLLRTASCLVALDSPEDEVRAVAWWEALTEAGGEGMVVKPRDFVAVGPRGPLQPALKCRGREYLRLIYGPDYDQPENLERLRERGLATKRSLAMREFALGVEALERFVRREPLRRVHECVFAVLALESEPVDPRL